MREVKDTVRSTVTIGFDGRVHKTFRGTDADKRFATEVKVLKYLENCGCNYVPQVLEHDPLRLYMVELRYEDGEIVRSEPGLVAELP